MDDWKRKSYDTVPQPKGKFKNLFAQKNPPPAVEPEADLLTESTHRPD